MSYIPENLCFIHREIAEACGRVGRSPEEVKLIAVSKTFPPEFIEEAHAAGQMSFGESKLQEAEPKVASLPRSLDWHFIGRVQRNKVRKILAIASVLHGIDSLRLAAHTNQVAQEMHLRPKLFLQVNIANEESKGGFSPVQLLADFPQLHLLHEVEIVGLMTIPPAGEDEERSRPWFAQLRSLRDEIQKEYGVFLPSLSMGMSGDFRVAIEEGATHVRVGSSIFGKRAYRVDGELG